MGTFPLGLRGGEHRPVQFGSGDGRTRPLGTRPRTLPAGSRHGQHRRRHDLLLPYVGEAIAILLGLMRSNVWITTLAMFAGKALRYVAVLYAVQGAISLL